MKIITGRTGEPHVYAADDAELYKLFLGSGDFCLMTGNKLEATMHGTNAVRVADGSLIMQGRLAKIRTSDGYDELALDIGVIGMKRVDLIVAEYNQIVTEREVEHEGEVVTVRDKIESIELKVIKGTPNASMYIEPEIVTGNIDNGETHQMKLWAVKLDGINFDSLVDYRVYLDTTPIQTALDVATQSVAQIRTMMATLTTELIEYAEQLHDDISQGFKGRWRAVEDVTDSSSAIAVTMPQDYVYSVDDAIEVYLEGLRLVSTEYSITGSANTVNVTLNSGTFTGQMEVVIYRITTEA